MSISVDGVCSSSSENTNPELDNLSIIACLGTESEQSDNSSNNNKNSNNSTNNNSKSDKNSSNINSSSSIDVYSNNYIKTNSTNNESSQDDHSSNYYLNNNTEWKDLQASTGYSNQFSFDPGLTSSESEGDYERSKCNNI